MIKLENRRLNRIVNKVKVCVKTTSIIIKTNQYQIYNLIQISFQPKPEKDSILNKNLNQHPPKQEEINLTTASTATKEVHP